MLTKQNHRQIIVSLLAITPNLNSSFMSFSVWYDSQFITMIFPWRDSNMFIYVQVISGNRELFKAAVVWLSFTERGYVPEVILDLKNWDFLFCYILKVTYVLFLLSNLYPSYPILVQSLCCQSHWQKTNLSTSCKSLILDCPSKSHFKILNVPIITKKVVHEMLTNALNEKLPQTFFFFFFCWMILSTATF